MSNYQPKLSMPREKIEELLNTENPKAGLLISIAFLIALDIRELLIGIHENIGNQPPTSKILKL